MAFIDKINENESFLSIYEMWGRKTPSYEKHYEVEVIKPLTDFGKGTNETSEERAKVLGAGYEVLIMAFFIGLYSNKRKPFGEDCDLKDLGQPLHFWGNVDSKKNRRAYPKLREYMFIALVARTNDIDWIELDKGKWTANDAVGLIMQSMEEFINYGLSVIYEKMQEDDTYYMNRDSFLNQFLKLTGSINAQTDEEELESLD